MNPLTPILILSVVIGIVGVVAFWRDFKNGASK